MIYYFAHKGYLAIDLTDEDDPTLIQTIDALPSNEPIYAKTLFKGLFRSGKKVCVSDLSEKFYQDAQTATLQLPSPKMYERKSVCAFIGGCLLGLLPKQT
jgi:hypothetical protein